MFLIICPKNNNSNEKYHCYTVVSLRMLSRIPKANQQREFYVKVKELVNPAYNIMLLDAHTLNIILCAFSTLLYCPPARLGDRAVPQDG